MVEGGSKLMKAMKEIEEDEIDQNVPGEKASVWWQHNLNPEYITTPAKDDDLAFRKTRSAFIVNSHGSTSVEPTQIFRQKFS